MDKLYAYGPRCRSTAWEDGQVAARNRVGVSYD
jgi:hypothetical protein